jgi:arylsulfatase A-like enzyme
MPDAGYRVADVLVNSVSVGAVSSYTFTGVTSDNTIEVSFGIDKFSLIVAKDGTGAGTVSDADLLISCGSKCSADYAPETQVTLTASPDSHSSFTGWSGDCSGTQHTCTVKLDRTRTTSATFMLLSPQPPASLTAVAVSSSRIDLTWLDGTDVETAFLVERKTDRGGVYFQIATLSADTTAYSDTGLKPDVIYYYRVRSVNYEVYSGYSAETSAKTASAPPGAPSKLFARAVSSASIVLSWEDNSGNENGFSIERKWGDCDSTGPWHQAARKGANWTKATFTDLKSNTKYSFRVKAYNGDGESAYSSCATARTGASGTPNSPADLTAAANTSGKIMLVWTDNSADETGFSIFRKAGSEPWTLLATTALDTRQYLDSQAPKNNSSVKYKYYIQACGTTGCSPPTATVTVPFSPLNLAASAGRSDQISLTWTDTNNGDYSGMKIFRKDGECSSDGAWLLIADSGYPATAYTDNGLGKGLTYSYKVRLLKNSPGLPPSSGKSLMSKCSSATTVIPLLTSVVVKPSMPSISTGKSLSFKAIGEYSDGTTLDLTSSVTWNSSDNAILQVNDTDEKGLGEAAAVGHATVSASYGALTGSASAVVTDTVRPNIIFILTDDMSIYDLPYMTNVNSLLKAQGMNFTDAFVSTSLCCPSRTSILRGQYAHNHQVYTNASPIGGYLKFLDRGLDESNIATWLQDAGYRTVLIGKFLNGYSPDKGYELVQPPGWDEFYAKDSSYYYNYDLIENGVTVHYGGNPEDYLTDVEAAKTYDFIRRAAADWRPFFAYLAPFAPHYGTEGPNDHPLIATPVPALRHQNEFPDVKAPRLPSFNEEDMGDKPEVMRSLPFLTTADMSIIDYRFRVRLQSLLAVDEMLGGIMDTLRETGQLDRTYIFFFSDNGFQFGEHRMPSGKGGCYEEAIRTPFVVRGPGVSPGTTDDHFVLNIDLAPTFAELAGIPVPDFVDGRSIGRLLKGDSVPEQGWRRAILLENWVGGLTDYHRSAIRTKDYKFVRWDPTAETEFYYLITDPYEMQSLHDTANPDLLQGYSDWLSLLNQCAGQGCRDAENLPPPQ